MESVIVGSSGKEATTLAAKVAVDLGRNNSIDYLITDICQQSGNKTSLTMSPKKSVSLTFKLLRILENE